jgi:Flp pilus assembly pilin Flp
MRSSIQIKIRRAKRTLLGRTLCRLAGDRTGAVMMEYVILGVLVAAAAVTAVLMFGTDITRGFNKMIAAVRGQPAQAEEQSRAPSDTTTDLSNNETKRKKIATGE